MSFKGARSQYFESFLWQPKLQYRKKNTKGLILKQKGTSQRMAEDGKGWNGLEMTILRSLANFFKIHVRWHSSFTSTEKCRPLKQVQIFPQSGLFVWVLAFVCQSRELTCAPGYWLTTTVVKMVGTILRNPHFPLSPHQCWNIQLKVLTIRDFSVMQHWNRGGGKLFRTVSSEIWPWSLVSVKGEVNCGLIRSSFQPILTMLVG